MTKSNSCTDLAAVTLTYSEVYCPTQQQFSLDTIFACQGGCRVKKFSSWYLISSQHFASFQNK